MSNGEEALVFRLCVWVLRGEAWLGWTGAECWWPVLLLWVEVVLLAQELVMGGEERRLAEEWDGCSLEEVGGGGEACPFKMFMRWWRRHLARLLENQT